LIDRGYFNQLEGTYRGEFFGGRMEDWNCGELLGGAAETANLLLFPPTRD
jgi:hypothetical protein